MNKARHLLTLAIAMGLAGCTNESATPPPAGGAAPAASSQPTTPKAKTPAPAPTSGEAKKDEAPPLEPPKTGETKPTAKPVSLTTEELANIRKLPAADQDSAIKQALCPISGDHLGNMDTPFKITVEGRTFFLCCQGCESKAKKDPKTVFAALDYESFMHPFTILTTLPSASIGAMLALMIFNIDLNVISIIGIILLIGIVKKNAIMMIDFALDGGTRGEQKTTYDAISRPACCVSVPS